MIHRQATIFFAGLHQHIGVVLVIRAAANGALLDKQFKAVFAGGAPVELVLAPFAELQRQQRVCE